MPFEDNDWLIGLRYGAYDQRSSSSPENLAQEVSRIILGSEWGIPETFCAPVASASRRQRDNGCGSSRSVPGTGGCA